MGKSLYFKPEHRTGLRIVKKKKPKSIFRKTLDFFRSCGIHQFFRKDYYEK